MTTTTAIKRLEALSLSKTSKAYIFAKQIIEGTKTIRPCYTSGSGRFTSNQNHTSALCSVLDKINVKYTLTNDSRRGGKPGNLITVKTKFTA